ncbi:MAG: protease modulator HflC [Luminiphilus sp.]|jgi:membrane protease subunit HflC|uniref:Protein HflC n=1 Tax=Candidatus Paraluminiphilus aquimaris TaxID=2518994 RepID=A0ABY6Q6G6_9GAMM|nr:protease modulator HflC [Candidatus Paraluminiphilus aquimaris]MCH1459737.1 protease modulator HflC [Luminiphilus sp.]UZP74023.1 protease modulator HflC [Candidatus Paraluminiphilus aquimaris]
MSRSNLLGTLLFLGFIVLSNSVYVISETQRGVLLKFGEVVKSDLEPGLHFKTPFVNSVRKFDGRILTVDSTPERFFTQEQKQLIVDSYAKFRVVDTAKYYTATSGEEFRAAALLSQRINDDLRNQVAGRTVQEVVSGERDQLMEAVKARLNETVLAELGIEVIDVRVKKIDLPNEVSQSVYRRMNAEREKEARELRSEGKEIAEGMRAEADRKVTVIEAEAVRDAEIIRGDGDATATRIYADSFNRDPEFYAFTRSLNAYQQTFSTGSDIMLLQPDSQFFQYLRDPKAGK